MNNVIVYLKELFDLINIGIIVNILLSLIMGLSIFTYIHIRKSNNIKNTLSQQKKKENMIKMIKMKTVKNSLYQATERYFEFKKTKYTPKQFYFGISAIIVSLTMFFIISRNIILAVITPIVLYVFSTLLLTVKTLKIKDIFSQQMHIVINNTIKILSRHEDIKTVIFELSQDLKEPLRTHFLNLSRKMVTISYDDALLDFAKKIDSVWLYAYVFLLMNSKKESNKSDIIVNLRILSKMLEEENIAQNKKMAERKGMVVINSVLSAIAVVGFLGNLTFNPVAYNYFFHTIGGIIALIVGLIAIMCTIYINMKLTKREYR